MDETLRNSRVISTYIHSAYSPPHWARPGGNTATKQTFRIAYKYEGRGGQGEAQNTGTSPAMAQKALFVESAPNGPQVVRSKGIPKPGPGELLVKVYAAALNPVDWIVRAMNIIVPEWPAVLGEDGAGTVEEVGPDVTGFSTGDRVYV